MPPLSTHLDGDVLEQCVLQDSLQLAVDLQRQLQCHARVHHTGLEHRGHDASMTSQADLGGGRGGGGKVMLVTGGDGQVDMKTVRSHGETTHSQNVEWLRRQPTQWSTWCPHSPSPPPALCCSLLAGARVPASSLIT